MLIPMLKAVKVAMLISHTQLDRGLVTAMSSSLHIRFSISCLVYDVQHMNDEE